MRKYVAIIIVIIFSVCSGCGTKDNKSTDRKNETEMQQDMDVGENEELDIGTDTDKTEMQKNQPSMDENAEGDTEKLGSNNIVINTEYIPIEYRQNALIVQRSQEIGLYGLVDNQGNTVLEPEYDALSFTRMNGNDFIKATLAEDTAILDLDGKQHIEMGRFENIVSAGDIGWLALRDGKQCLLDEKGNILKEFNGTYNLCFGNKYLFRSKFNSGEEMSDGWGGDSCNLNLSLGEIYDLDENLLLSSDEMDIGLFQWLVSGDVFGTEDMLGVVIIGAGLKLIDMEGKIIAEVGDVNTNIIEPIINEQKIILRHSLEPTENLVEFNLLTSEITATEFSHEDSWNAQIIVKQSGDFYQFYKDGELLLDERFADYSFNDGVLWLENIDSEWGIVDYSGNIIIPFGEIDSRDSFFEGGNLPILTSKGMFGFYTQDNENYEFHNYVVAEGRL